MLFEAFALRRRPRIWESIENRRLLDMKPMMPHRTFHSQRHAFRFRAA